MLYVELRSSLTALLLFVVVRGWPILVSDVLIAFLVGACLTVFFGVDTSLLYAPIGPPYRFVCWCQAELRSFLRAFSIFISAIICENVTSDSFMVLRFSAALKCAPTCHFTLFKLMLD